MRVIEIEAEVDRHAPWKIEGVPIDVSALLHERLWTRLEAGVFCSATLATHGDSFGFFLRRSGLGRLEGSRVMVETLPHIFDYKNRPGAIMQWRPGNT